MVDEVGYDVRKKDQAGNQPQATNHSRFLLDFNAARIRLREARGAHLPPSRAAHGRNSEPAPAAAKPI